VSTFTVRGIYRGEQDLHQIGEIGLEPGASWPAGWSGLH
jgi:hypothetical protein